MWWWSAAFLVLFVWHEIDEYRVLLPWVEQHHDRLPGFVRKLQLTAPKFTLIAVEELFLLLLIAFFLPPVWFAGAVIAYTVHLLVHCGQMAYTYYLGIPLGLWSAPVQLPIIGFLLATMPDAALSSSGSFSLTTTSLIMTGVMIANLFLAHVVMRGKARN